MDKQVSYGIIGCCIGIIAGFAVGFPIWYQLPFEKRGYIGVPMMPGYCNYILCTRRHYRSEKSWS